MRHSCRDSRADTRESVHVRPAHLDDLIARINAGETYADDADSATSSMSHGSGISDRYRDRGSDGPSDAAMTNAMTSNGRACMMSITRCVSRSNQPNR